jgi:hypothetical protein
MAYHQDATDGGVGHGEQDCELQVFLTDDRGEGKIGWGGG